MVRRTPSSTKFCPHMNALYQACASEGDQSSPVLVTYVILLRTQAMMTHRPFEATSSIILLRRPLAWMEKSLFPRSTANIHPIQSDLPLIILPDLHPHGQEGKI